MTSAANVQMWLRFLSQDAKVPLPTAMGKVKELHKAGFAKLVTVKNMETLSGG